MRRKLLFLAGAMLAGLSPHASAQYPGWQHEGSLFIITTPDGADLPASAAEANFPLLVRLNKGSFDFSQTKPKGEDLRFSAGGKPLAYQIEDWDAASGRASVWVKIPQIQGNAHQELKVHWGKADAASESNGAAVFSADNGYTSVIHMNEALKDETGTLKPADAGTTVTPGVIGTGRHFAAGQGIRCGGNITTFPAGADPHSSECWFRAEVAGTNVLGWGNEAKQGKVVMSLASPPHLRMECYFSGADVASGGTLPLAQWVHVAHTYKDGDSRVYVNGVLDGVSTSAAAPLAIKQPANFWIGGWQNDFNFAGDIDEVRISKVARSAAWIKLEYENQKPLQTLVGLIDGQSNAEATGPNNGPDEDPVTPASEWIRSYGNQLEGTTRGGWGNAVRTHIWGKPNYGCHQIGAWGMELATNLVAKYSMPICILNGAYGGTPIWQHQVNPTNRLDTSGEFYHNPYKIYGGLLTRVTAAKLTHGIRGVFWHQGENDSGSGAPTGDWNYKSYQQYFMDMAAAWKQDYPNIRNYYVYQVWPLPCGMGPKDDGIREAQRTLPTLFSNLRVMSTIGAASEHAGRGACHFDLAGYAKFAEFMSPLVEQDHYGLKPTQPVTAPNLKRAWFTTTAKDEIALDFGQPMVWNDEAKINLYLDNQPAAISTGRASGTGITLKLAKPSAATQITYLTGRDWDGKPTNLLFGANKIAALTFCDVGIGVSATAEPARLHFERPDSKTQVRTNKPCT